MIDFDEFSSILRKSTNFATADNFEQKWAIIEETLGLQKHRMLMGKACQTCFDGDLASTLETIDLIDFWEMEKVYGGNQKR